VPEIVEEGVTGYGADTPQEFQQAIPKAFTLDRRRIRQQAEQRFSPERMAREYACVYEQMIARK